MTDKKSFEETFSQYMNAPEEPIQTQPLASEIIADLEALSRTKAMTIRWIMEDVDSLDVMDRINDSVFEILHQGKEPEDSLTKALKIRISERLENDCGKEQLIKINSFISGMTGID